MKATLTNYRQAPRKVRLVTDLIKGKKVEAAVAELSFLPKRAALPILKLLNSAVSNAEKNSGSNKEDLFIKNILVDKGIVLKRFMPRARGSASPIYKRMSHVVIILEDRAQKPALPTEAKKEKKEKAPAQKAEPKIEVKPKKAPAKKTVAAKKK